MLGYFRACWDISEHAGIFPSMLGYFRACWDISKHAGIFPSLLGYFRACWDISKHAGIFPSMLGYFLTCFITVKRPNRRTHWRCSAAIWWHERKMSITVYMQLVKFMLTHVLSLNPSPGCIKRTMSISVYGVFGTQM